MKIGFACQRWPQQDQWKIRATTQKHLQTLSKRDARIKLESIALENAHNLMRLVQTVLDEEPGKHMLRIGDGLLPFWDHPDYQGEYNIDPVREIFAGINYIAKGKVDLSFHPGQFNALASQNPKAVENTIFTLNTAGFIAAEIGASIINIHVWGRDGIDGFKSNMQYLDQSIRERITVENDEFGVGLQAILDADIGCPVVLDSHHHWVNTGQWPNEELFYASRQTWTNDAPAKIHYSYPRDHGEVKSGWPTTSGSRTADRAHSDSYGNRPHAIWHLEMAQRHGFNIMCEAKMKDVARDKLYRLAGANGYV